MLALLLGVHGRVRLPAQTLLAQPAPFRRSAHAHVLASKGEYTLTKEWATAAQLRNASEWYCFPGRTEQNAAGYEWLSDPTHGYQSYDRGCEARDGYRQNLLTVRSKALANGNIPFWNYFFTLPYQQHRDPSYGELVRLVGRTEVPAILGAYDWAAVGLQGSGTVVDIGGGYGELSEALHLAHPKLRCINFDLPGVIAEAPAWLGLPRRHSQ